MPPQPSSTVQPPPYALRAGLAPATSDTACVRREVQASICLNGQPKHFIIVGDDKADPAAGMISFKPPLSEAIGA